MTVVDGTARAGESLGCRVASAPSQPEAELRERQAAVREAFTEIVGPVVRRSE